MSVPEFFAALGFEPDAFQRKAAESIASGRSVVVTAPTGAGKTLVAEVAIHLALGRGQRAYYTTPIKALSNQKYGDLVTAYGAERVGLLTGDNVINPGGDVVVMTTEVLRNMIYADPAELAEVGVVILDEVHYLQDRFRGAVWEEVIVHAPPHLQMVALSATIANADEFSDWVETRRGPTDLILTSERPVPLESRYLLRDRIGHRLELLPTFVTEGRRARPNPRILRMLAADRGRGRRFTTPRRMEVIEELWNEDMLPAIYFIFSRAGCEAAANTLTQAGLRLVDPEAREEIRRIADQRIAHLSDGDLAVLGYGRWIAALESGIAAHHAGMVPAFKETVEELFARGMLGVVFATETLALGINMPARTVVLESLSKFDGESHDVLAPGDYTQLTGRAGRRGIDEVGYGVVLHSRYVRFEEVARVAAAGSHPLLSSFRPTYNMAANLVANYPEERAIELLEASFGEFQRSGGDDPSAEIVEMEKRLAEEKRRAECDQGSISEYARLVEGGGLTDGARLAPTLRPGDVIDIPGGKRAGRYAVLKLIGQRDTVRYLVAGTSGRVSTLGTRDVVEGSTRAGAIDLPVPFRPRDRRFRQDVVRAMRRIPPGRQRRRPPERLHPVTGCPDLQDHLHWLARARKTEQRLERLRKSRRERGRGLAAEFEAIRGLLTDWGYLAGWGLTPRGDRLRFVYNEMDLLLTETYERGILEDLDEAELAALCASFVYEPRRDSSPPPQWPTMRLSERWEGIEKLWSELTALEADHNLPPTRRPEPGLAVAMYRWARGADFEEVEDRLMAPGDFVRVSRQLVDLLRQIRDAFPGMRPDADAALAGIDRGVVAAQGVG